MSISYVKEGELYRIQVIHDEIKYISGRTYCGRSEFLKSIKRLTKPYVEGNSLRLIGFPKHYVHEDIFTRIDESDVTENLTNISNGLITLTEENDNLKKVNETQIAQIKNLEDKITSLQEDINEFKNAQFQKLLNKLRKYTGMRINQCIITKIHNIVNDEIITKMEDRREYKILAIIVYSGLESDEPKEYNFKQTTWVKIIEHLQCGDVYYQGESRDSQFDKRRLLASRLLINLANKLVNDSQLTLAV